MPKATPTPTPQSRDQYGALRAAEVVSPEQVLQVHALRDAAVKAGLLPAPFMRGSKKEFECLNLDIYDILLFRGKVKGLVVQARTFWKHVRKGYTRSGKDYFLVLKSAGRIQVSSLESATCVKRAKNTLALGELVGHYLGKTVVKCKSPAVPTWTGYKVLAKDDAGRLLSAFDDSLYTVDRWRAQAANEDHGGGFYYYLDRELAVAATSRGHTFSDSVSAGKRLVLCEVEVSGRDIAYDGGKRAASRLRVIRELQGVEVAEAD